MNKEFVDEAGRDGVVMVPKETILKARDRVRRIVDDFDSRAKIVDRLKAIQGVDSGVCDANLSEAKTEYTGSSVSYYKTYVAHPTTIEQPYYAEANDIIEALGMSFAEGNAFKAIWRRCAARQGLAKKGYTDGLYDAEKIVFFGQRLVEQEKTNK